jgi:hypothetical protein
MIKRASQVILDGKLFQELYVQPTRDKYGLPNLLITTRPNPIKATLIITLEERVRNTSLISWAEISDQEIQDTTSFIRTLEKTLESLCLDFARMKAEMLLKELK